VPIYEFRCRACEVSFEVLVRGVPHSVCRKCGSEDTERLVSGFAVASADRHRAAVQSKRRENAPQGRDQAVADYEEFKHHRD
jgi:putative FmdB family regulatory protein